MDLIMRITTQIDTSKGKQGNRKVRQTKEIKQDQEKKWMT